MLRWGEKQTGHVVRLGARRELDVPCRSLKDRFEQLRGEAVQSPLRRVKEDIPP